MELDTGLLLILGEVPTQFEGRFNEWYDDDHVPARLFVPGIVAARRYKQLIEDTTSRPVTYLASYELANLDVLDSDAYKALATGVSSDLEIEVRKVATFDRRVYRATSTPDSAKAHDVTVCGPYLLCVWENGTVDHSGETEQSQLHGVLRTRRYRMGTGQGAELLAIYDIESREALDELIENESLGGRNNGDDSGAELRLFQLHRRFDTRLRLLHRQRLSRDPCPTQTKECQRCPHHQSYSATRSTFTYTRGPTSLNVTSPPRRPPPTRKRRAWRRSSSRVIRRTRRPARDSE